MHTEWEVLPSCSPADARVPCAAVQVVRQRLASQQEQEHAARKISCGLYARAITAVKPGKGKTSRFQPTCLHREGRTERHSASLTLRCGRSSEVALE